MNPEISVIIAAYNRKDRLRLCLDSLANQTHRNFEIIIADDGSKDDIRRIDELFKHIINIICV